MSTNKSGQGGQSRGAGCGAVSTEELEALLQGSLPVEQRTVIAAHTESCAQCLKELTWLRTESGLFAERAKRTPVPQLWTQVEQQLARRRRRTPAERRIPLCRPGTHPRSI